MRSSALVFYPLCVGLLALAGCKDTDTNSAAAEPDQRVAAQGVDGDEQSAEVVSAAEPSGRPAPALKRKGATGSAAATPSADPASVSEPKPTLSAEALEDRKQASAAVSEMFFKHYGVNPTIDTEEENKSSFALDVDTASYAVARALLEKDKLPDEAAVRVEEFINYFDYHYDPPQEADFSLHAEVVPSAQRSGYHVLHLGLKARNVAGDERSPASLVFVIDVSGSMGKGGRLAMVKDALRVLVQQLSPSDRVGIVVYGSSARVVLEPTPGNARARITAAVDRLRPEGATNVQAGLRLAYELASKQAGRAAINRVILCSDGVANTGAKTAESILASVAEHAGRGITISTVGVGMGHYNDVLMEQLADKGDGNYSYVDRLQEAQRVFVKNLTGTLQVVARDAKLQLEFDKSVVARYRLLGYENRALTKDEFQSERTDAGEIGAGHAVTAVYEIKLKPTEAANFGVVRLHYKSPRSGEAKKIERKLPMSLVREGLGNAAPPTRLSMVAAAFAEKLRGSYWVRNLSWEQIQGMYNEIPPELARDADVAELGALIARAGGLDQRTDKFESDMPLARMEFDRVPVLKE